jgi:hypothetical protein
MKMRRYIISVLAILAFASGAPAQDETPYNFAGLGGSRGTWSITTIAKCHDMLSHYRNVSAAVFDSVLDSANAMGKTNFIAGFYGSSQELGPVIYDLPNWNTQYAERMGSSYLPQTWYWYLIAHYLDSIGVSTDSCCLNFLDTAWWFINDGRGDGRNRLVENATILNYKERRLSYQTYDNDADDTAFYPAGYAWLANGGNANVRAAIAYAMRRRFFDNSIKSLVEGGTYGPMNYLYMDNQYENAGFLGSYWSVCPKVMWYAGEKRCRDSSHCPSGKGINCDSIVTYTGPYGGPTAGMDLSNGYTNIGIESGGAGNATYHLNSTLPIDGAIKSCLDSVSAANGYDSVETFANVDWADSGRALRVAPYVSGIFLEGPIQPDRTAGLWNQQWKISVGLIKTRNTTFACYYMPGGGFGSYFTEGQNRPLMAHYCFFLVVQNYNEGKYWTYYMPDGSLSMSDNGGVWRNIYEVNLGIPQDTAMNASYTGTGWYGLTPYNWVKRRNYGADTGAVVLFRTTAGTTYDYNADSIPINLADGRHKLWKRIGINADTSLIADSLFYIKPYMGIILIRAGEQPPAIGNILPTSGYRDSTYAVSALITDDFGVNRAYCSLRKPNGDSVFIADSALSPVSVSFTFSHDYQFLDSGNYKIIFGAADDSGHVTWDTSIILIDVPQIPPPVSTPSIKGRNSKARGIRGEILKEDIYCLVEERK